jgi:glycosyltransferase involved in cell wall biosynthesis/ubiquinone/menaquinone biosynthesis C-methylase UbiE
MSAVRLSILIPVYNEAASIQAVLERVVTASAAYFKKERLAVDLIVVDDGSEDDSCQQVMAFSRTHPAVPLRLIQHDGNFGEGCAIQTAISWAQSDLCLIQDADLGYDPADYAKLLQPLLSDQADVVLGSRFLNISQRGPLRFWQAIANRILSSIAGMSVGLKLSDVETGYKAFRTALARSIPLYSNRFGLDPELVVQFARRHARFIEVPISCHARTYEHGKKNRERDALWGIASILRARLFSPAHTDPAADMLVAMSRARRFNKWMADTITPFIAGEVLELGAGIGNMTVLLATAGRRYVATDSDKEHLAELHSRMAGHPNVKLGVCDFSNALDASRYCLSADTVICLNVLEHVTDDMAGLANIRACLRPGGTAIVLVPQGPRLFGTLDEVLQHERRYTRIELHEKMAATGFQMIQVIGFNRSTWPGWYLNSRLLRRRTLSRVQLHLFDLLVPLLRRMDDKLPWPPTSLIAIGTVSD